MQKLTDEQKQKVICLFDAFASEYLIDEDEDPDSEYTTEYALLMKQKDEEFKNYLLEDREPSEIKKLLTLYDEYMDACMKEDPFYICRPSELMSWWFSWLHKSPVPSVFYDLEWKELLKDKKVKRKKDSKVQKEPVFMPKEKSYPNTSVKPKEELQKLTNEQKQKIIRLLDAVPSKYFLDENPEYVIWMKQIAEEYNYLKDDLLKDSTPSEIKMLLEICDDYMTTERTCSGLDFLLFNYI